MSGPVWKLFEKDVLESMGVGAVFSAVELAEMLGIETSDASEWVQSYLTAQRSEHSQTKFILVRKDRTRAAKWTISRRTKDSRELLIQFGHDLRCTVERAVRPDLQRISDINPRAARAVEEAILPMLDSLVATVTAVMVALGWDDDEEGLQAS